MSDFIWFLCSTSGVLATLALGALWLWAQPRSTLARRFMLAAALFYSAASVYIVPATLGRPLTRGYQRLTARDVPSGVTAIVLLGAGGETVVGWEKDRPLSILDLDGAARVLEAARVFRLIDPAWIISSGGLQSQHVGIDEAEFGGGKMRVVEGRLACTNSTRRHRHCSQDLSVVSFNFIGDTMTSEPSGRFVLRTLPALHRALRRRARERGVSLNAYCVRRLSAPAAALPTEAAAVVSWATDAFGDAVAGVIAYGSWARGETTGDSDVDVLIVLDASVGLTRDIYRRCDGATLLWDGHPVQLQIVHMPSADRAAGGLWPEIALDGMMLFERGFHVSRRLVAIRRAIADGRLVRRTAHGQPYWTTTEAA